MKKTTFESGFDIQLIKAAYPELNKYFGFTYNDISYELDQTYIRKTLNLTQEEKDLIKQYKSEAAMGEAAMNFLLQTQDVTYIRVTEDFSEFEDTIDELYDDYKIAKLKDGAKILFILRFIGAIFKRDFNHLLDDTEYAYIKDDYDKYAYKIRPDMLKLYIALHQEKRQVSDKLKIVIQGNSAKLENYECWFEEMLKDYLNQKLGVESKEEAQTELDTLYPNWIGRKTEEFYRNYIFTSIFLFVQDNIIHSETNIVTVEQCEFLQKYLTSLKVIRPEDVNYIINNLRSTIKSLIISSKTPLDKYKLSKQYQFSPKNKGDRPY